jgi:hypothetical protein
MPDQFKPTANKNFIEFRPNGEDFKLASERSEKMGILQNSYTRGAGRMSGMLGEIAVHKYLQDIAEYSGDSVRGYDLITDKEIKIEVKTKKASRMPDPSYAATVEHKKTYMFVNDIFVFLRGHDSMAKFWLLGWIKTPSFKRLSEFKKIGEVDEDSGFKHRVDEYTIPIAKLKPMSTLVDYLKSQ